MTSREELVAALRRRLAEIREEHKEAPVKSLDELKTERPGFAARLAAIEAQHPAPPMKEPEPEESA